MERFIDIAKQGEKKREKNLKSSMERFIGETANGKESALRAFKIQYGEIYRVKAPTVILVFDYLKSSMERFIVR